MKRTAIAATILLALTGLADAAPKRGYAENVQTIPHPAGCPHRLFCACGLRLYWNIPDPALNKVSNWAHKYPRTSGPAVGVAAVRIGGYHDHVIGIVGGGPGAWEVIDFNSGHGTSHRYVTSGFPGYFFVRVT